MRTIPHNPLAHDHYREWLSTINWNIGVTIQPGNPQNTADDLQRFHLLDDHHVVHEKVQNESSLLHVVKLNV